MLDREREAVIAPIALAGRFRSRVRGLLGARPNEEVLLLMPCNDVHTVGMADPIDIAFVGEDGLVIESYRDVGPRRRLRCARAVGVLERFSTCEGPWFAVGERVGIACSGGGYK